MADEKGERSVDKMAALKVETKGELPQAVQLVAV